MLDYYSFCSELDHYKWLATRMLPSIQAPREKTTDVAINTGSEGKDYWAHAPSSPQSAQCLFCCFLFLFYFDILSILVMCVLTMSFFFLLFFLFLCVYHTWHVKCIQNFPFHFGKFRIIISLKISIWTCCWLCSI